MSSRTPTRSHDLHHHNLLLYSRAHSLTPHTSTHSYSHERTHPHTRAGNSAREQDANDGNCRVPQLEQMSSCQGSRTPHPLPLWRSVHDLPRAAHGRLSSDKKGGTLDDGFSWEWVPVPALCGWAQPGVQLQKGDTLDDGFSWECGSARRCSARTVWVYTGG
jgi:hypothetical protein